MLFECGRFIVDLIVSFFYIYVHCIKNNTKASAVVENSDFTFLYLKSFIP
jgi:hypothetical protein